MEEEKWRVWKKLEMEVKEEKSIQHFLSLTQAVIQSVSQPRSQFVIQSVCQLLSQSVNQLRRQALRTSHSFRLSTQLNESQNLNLDTSG